MFVRCKTCGKTHHFLNYVDEKCPVKLPKNPRGKLLGDNPSYNAIHKYMLRHHKKQGICSVCGEAKRTHWSNKTGKYNRMDINDWQEMCPKCHHEYDIKVLNKKISVGRKKDLFKLEADKWGTKAEGLARLKTYVWYRA